MRYKWENFTAFFLYFRHTFKVSKSLLLELYDHTLEVRVWNSKSKLSARARYDRPKAFRLPAPTAKKILQSESEEQGKEGDETSSETNQPPLIRRPSKLPVVSHDRVRGGAYKAGRRLNQVWNLIMWFSIVGPVHGVKGQPFAGPLSGENCFQIAP